MMPSHVHRLIILLVLMAGLSGVQAQRVSPLPALSGTSLTLSTSASRIVPTPLRPSSAPPVLGAMVTLRNNARQPATFTFPDPDLAHSKFTFSLFNAENTLVWTGAGSPTKRSGVPTSADVKLAPRSSWQAAVRIPLATEGTWLPSGTYRLEATLNGTPVTFAATSFEIATVSPPPEPGPSGIMGLVLAPATAGISQQTPAGGASITIEPVVTSTANSPATRTFSYQGVSAADGRFDAKLPPGTYLVRASWSPPQSEEVQASNQTAMNPVSPVTASSTVVVPKGRMTPLTIRLSAPRVPIRPLQPASPPVLSVDEVSAMVILAEDGSKKIRIQASGTVPHPGYTNARLVTPLIVPAITAAEGNILFLQFVADAPPPDLFYPQVIVSVSAEITLPFNEETQVWIFSQTNTKTTPVGSSSQGSQQ